MKKYLSSLLLIFLFFEGLTQPVVPRMTSSSNTSEDRRVIVRDNFIIPRYQDTAAANLNKGIDSCGAKILTYDGGNNREWTRMCLTTGKRWVEIKTGTSSGVDSFYFDMKPIINSKNWIFIKGNGTDTLDLESTFVYEVTKSQLDSLIAISALNIGGIYKVTGVARGNSSINKYAAYDDGTNSGVTVYLTAQQNNLVSEDGYGVFYNPKWEVNNLYGTNSIVWRDYRNYAIGDTVIWGGYYWKAKTAQIGYDGYWFRPHQKTYAIGDTIRYGRPGDWTWHRNITGSNSDTLTPRENTVDWASVSQPSWVKAPINTASLNLADWDVIPYTSPLYRKSIDVVKYNYDNDNIFMRYEAKTANYVLAASSGDDINRTPTISLMKWGAYYYIDPNYASHGVFNISSTTSRVDLVNEKFRYQIGNVIAKSSTMQDNIFDGAAYINNLSLEAAVFDLNNIYSPAHPTDPNGNPWYEMSSITNNNFRQENGFADNIIVATSIEHNSTTNKGAIGWNESFNSNISFNTVGLYSYINFNKLFNSSIGANKMSHSANIQRTVLRYATINDNSIETGWLEYDTLSDRSHSGIAQFNHNRMRGSDITHTGLHASGGNYAIIQHSYFNSAEIYNAKLIASAANPLAGRIMGSTFSGTYMQNLDITKDSFSIVNKVIQGTRLDANIVSTLEAEALNVNPITTARANSQKSWKYGSVHFNADSSRLRVRQADNSWKSVAYITDITPSVLDSSASGFGIKVAGGKINLADTLPYAHWVQLKDTMPNYSTRYPGIEWYLEDSVDALGNGVYNRVTLTKNGADLYAGFEDRGAQLSVQPGGVAYMAANGPHITGGGLNTNAEISASKDAIDLKFSTESGLQGRLFIDNAVAEFFGQNTSISSYDSTTIWGANKINLHTGFTGSINMRKWNGTDMAPYYYSDGYPTYSKSFLFLNPEGAVTTVPYADVATAFSYVAGNGIKISSGTIRWADTLSNYNTTITLPEEGNYSLKGWNDEGFYIVGSNMGAYMRGSQSQVYTDGNTVSVSGQGNASVISPDVSLNADSLRLKSYVGAKYAPKTTSLSKYKIAAIDSTTGAIVKVDPSLLPSASGTAGQLGVFNSSNSLTGYSGLIWNNTSNILSVTGGTRAIDIGVPSSRVHTTWTTDGAHQWQIGGNAGSLSNDGTFSFYANTYGTANGGFPVFQMDETTGKSFFSNWLSVGGYNPQSPLHVYSGTLSSGINDILTIQNAWSTGNEIPRIKISNVSNTTLAGIDFPLSPNSSSGAIAFSTNLDGTVSEKVRIDGNGNVGLGTTTPPHSLSILGDDKFLSVASTSFNYSTGAPIGAKFGYNTNSGAAGINFHHWLGSAAIFDVAYIGQASYIPAQWGLDFRTENVSSLTDASPSRMFIHRNGNIGINTTTDAGFKLDVNGTARVSNLGGSGNTAVYTDNNGQLIKVPSGSDGNVLGLVGGVPTWSSVGDISGTGTAGQVTFWDGTKHITGDNGFLWNNTTKKITVTSSSSTAGAAMMEFNNTNANGLAFYRGVNNIGNSMGISVTGDNYVTAYDAQNIGTLSATGTLRALRIVSNGESENGGSMPIVIQPGGFNEFAMGTFHKDYLRLGHSTVENIQVTVTSTAGLMGIGTYSPSAALDIKASTTAYAAMRLRTGFAPTTPNDGEIWLESNSTTGLKMRLNGVTETFSFGGSSSYTAGTGLTLTGTQFKLTDTATKMNTMPITGDIFNLTTIPTGAERNYFYLSGSAAISVASGEMTMTGIGSVGTGNIINVPLDQASENWTQKVRIRCNVTTGTQRIGLGTRPSNRAGINRAFSGTFDMASGVDKGKVFIFTGNAGTFTQQTVSSALPSLNNGDTVELSVTRSGFTFTCKAKNIRTNDSVSTSYSYPITSSEPVMLPTSRPAIYQLNQGNQTLLNWSYTENTPANPYCLIIGDSKTTGHNTTTNSNRFVSTLAAAHTDSVYAFSGYGDELNDAVKWLHLIKRVKPKNVVIALGSNDVRNSQTEVSIAENLSRIIEACKFINANVYFLGMGENSINQSYLWQYAMASVGGDKMITAYPALAGDGVHLSNDAAHATVKAAIEAKLFP